MIFKSVIVLCLFINLNAYAQKKHIVFDVANTLVREVPRWLAPKLDVNKQIKITAQKRHDKDDTRDYHFMKMHYVEEMMTEIVKADIKISFYSGDQDFLIIPILKALKITDGSNRSFYDLVDDPSKDILLREDTVDTWDDAKKENMKGKWYDKTQRWKKDLSKISQNLSQMIYITPIENALIDGQEDNLFYLGYPLYYAKSYADAASNLKAAANEISSKPWLEKNYPQNKEEWSNDFYKNAYVYLVISELLAESTPLLDNLKKKLSEKRAHLTQIGMSKLDKTWKPFQFKFVLSDDQKSVTGCELINARELKKVSVANLPDCIENNNVDFDWVFDHDNLMVEHCILVDGVSGAFIENKSLEECISKKEVKTYWADQTKNKCSFYTTNLYLIKSTLNSQCDKEHVIPQPNLKKNTVVEYFDGMESLSFEEILASISFKTTVSLAKFNASTEFLGGISYPRVNHIMYRGMSAAQMSLEKAFMAMFGDQYSVVESKIVTILKHYLLGQNSPVNDNYGPISLRSVSQSIKKNNHEKLDKNKALRVAVEVLDKELQKRGDTALRNELVDQRSGYFNEWGGAGLYTAPFYDIAKLYGENVVAFKEETPRGVDKTFFEYKKYNNTGWPRVDSGEYIIPLYIPAKEIEGIHLSRSFRMYGANPYGNAFYKLEYEGKTYIGWVDSNGECIQKNSDGFVYTCHSNFSSVAFPNFPVIIEKVKYKGFFALCQENTPCSLPKGLTDKFPMSRAGTGTTVSMLMLIKKIRDIRGMNIRYFNKNGMVLAR